MESSNSLFLASIISPPIEARFVPAAERVIEEMDVETLDSSNAGYHMFWEWIFARIWWLVSISVVVFVGVGVLWWMSGMGR
jgi:multidrug efflux pump subunit AcrB